MISSSNNTTTLGYTKPLLDSIGLVAGLVIFYVVVAGCAISSNITILIAIVRRLVPRNTVNVFFSSLAASDLLMTVLSFLDCIAYLKGSWEFGEGVCKIQSLFLEVCFTASTFTLVAVSCERYLLICKPRMRRRTLRNIYIVLCGVWVAAFVITSPLLHGYIVYDVVDHLKKTRESVCANKGLSPQHTLIYYSTYSTVTYLLPLIIMAFTHWRISESVRENELRHKSSTNGPRCSNERIPTVHYKPRRDEELSTPDLSSTSKNAIVRDLEKSRSLPEIFIGLSLKIRSNSAEREQRKNDRRIKAVRMLFVVTVTFFVLWTPFIIMRIAVLAGHHINTYFYKFAEILILSSTAVNGFIYAYMSPPFRRAFKAILCCQQKSTIIQRYIGNTLSNSEETSRRLNCTVLTSPNPSVSKSTSYAPRVKL